MRFGFCALIDLILNAWIEQMTSVTKGCCKEKKFSFMNVGLQSSQTFFANHPILILITSFCDVALKIKSLLSMPSLMFKMDT
jgi:hypothetical protein